MICNQQNNTEIRDAWCAELSAENNAEFWSSDALESLKEYKMCKDVNVKHLGKKILMCTQCIGVPWKVISIDALFPIWNDNVMTDFKKIFLVLVASKFICERWTFCKINVLITRWLLHTYQ